MRDGISLFKSGHPTVLIVDAPFEQSARAQIKALGACGLPVYVCQQMRVGGDKAGEEAARGTLAADEVSALFLLQASSQGAA